MVTNTSSHDMRSLSPDEYRRLTTLATISHMLNGSAQVEEVLERALDIILQQLHAERAFVMLDVGNDVPEIVARRGVEDGTYSRKVVDHVLARCEAVLSDDAAEDVRFADSSSLKLQGVHSIMCVPMGSGDRCCGLIYVDTRLSCGLFDEADLELLRILSDLAAGALERAQLVSGLVQNEKLAALGTFVAGLAHEVNNPLTAISGAAQLMTEPSRSEAELREMAARVHQEARRCRDLVRNLLSLARHENVPRTPTPMSELVQRAADVVGPEFRQQGLDFQVDVPDDLPVLNVNADQLQQVLLNLLTNARQAVTGKGEPRISLRAAVTGGCVRLIVSDSGPGIHPRHLRQIFDPYFTTKPSGSGTGLGLSIAQRIVSEHGGSIQVYNNAPHGTVFTVKLPLTLKID